MPREVERQSDQHPPRLEDIPDSAYGQYPNWDDDLDFENMSPGHYNRLKHKFEEDGAHEQEAQDHALTRDEDSGANWGPPPPEHSWHDPGFPEDETDLYPYA